jgi:hypothetical protein
VRGHKVGGMLTAIDYNNLTQCETLDDMKLNLVRLDFVSRLFARPPARRSPIAARAAAVLLTEKKNDKRSTT